MVKLIKRAVKAFQFMKNHVQDPDRNTYYPNDPRKSRNRIIYENITWSLKHREIDHFYYLNGFDREGFDRFDDYFGEQEFIRLREKANAYYETGGHKTRYTCMLQDKFVFGQFLKGLGYPTPEILALCDQDGIQWLDSDQPESWEALSSHEGLDGFLKDTLGRCGEAVFPLSIKDGCIYKSGTAITGQALREMITGKYIIQQRVYQHSQMSAMYPHSINSIRLITLRKGNEFFVASGTFRMGAGGNRFDNWARGGIGVGIDVKTGKLNEEGTFRLGYGGRVKAHPETGMVFATYDIPFYQEAARMAVELHSFFYGVHSIGWDIAITEDGPIFIEGNNSWDIAFQQFHDGQLKKVFLDSLKA